MTNEQAALKRYQLLGLTTKEQNSLVLYELLCEKRLKEFLDKAGGNFSLFFVFKADYASLLLRRNEMTKVAVWCRHEGDNLIGIGAKLPWDVPSDKQFFKDLIKDQNVVMGRLTYESLPSRTLPECQIMVLTSDYAYKVSDKVNHSLVEDVWDLKDFAEDFYIAGGAKVYEAFMAGGPKLMPDIIVDCVYQGEANTELKGEKINITPCIGILNKKYFKLFSSEPKDKIIRNLYIKCGDFVDQAVVKSILAML